AEVPDSPTSTALRPAAGLGVRVQAVPFQCKISVPRPPMPVIHASLADIASTLTSRARAAAAGPGICVHTAPFQCRMNALPVLENPIAHASRAEEADTLLRNAVLP